MKQSLFMLAALYMGLAVSARAQVEGGTIGGIIHDEQGGVLPGVTVTLQGADATRDFTTDTDGTFRFLELAPGSYQLSAALQGFATIVQPDLVVAVGKTVDVRLTMKLAGVSETITVSGDPPIVDTKATGTATNFTVDELTKIPTSRDPFALLRTVPGVLVDRVNIGGNETGQQSNVASKGTRPQDAVWTIDGIVITDMTALGASPTYFNYDNFEEIQVATAGQDIKQPTGGLGVNLVVKRGTNQFHGMVRGYFDNDTLSASNVPTELAAQGVTPATADHNKQISDYGFDVGGPLAKDKAWFYGSYSIQDVRLVRHTGTLIDRTQLKDPDVKLNWQASSRDTVSFLYFDGFKIKDGRSPGTSGILFDAPSATFHQDNAYTSFPLHGLWKVADDRVITPNVFLSAKYAYYNTGFGLTPEGGLDQQAGRDFTIAQSFGSTSQSLNVRPQQVVNVDLNSFLTAHGTAHDVKYGVGFRRADAVSATLWPGNGVLAIENSPTDLRAQVFRQGLGTNRAQYVDVYAGDVISRNRVTLDVGLRYDRQSGQALPSTAEPNAAFSDLVPGLAFTGYGSPFTWNNVSPRAGVTYALDAARKSVVRTSYSRYAGQLSTGVVGFTNPSSVAGSATYRWQDLNSDHLAQANEVLTQQFLSAAGGFNPGNPTAVTSANQIDPNLKAPITQSIVAGFDRELMRNFAVRVDYSYTRTSNLFGNSTNNLTPRIGVTAADYAMGPALTGTLPDGAAYNNATFVPDAAKVAAGGSGFLLTNVPGYYTDYSGVDVNLVKRLSNRWMARIGFSYNNAREHFTSAEGRYEATGNPTPTLTEPLVDGGQFAPESGGSGSGTIFVNAKWQLNVNGLYQAAHGMELSANVFGRQGYPYPLFRQVSLGVDQNIQALVTPAIDTLRFPNLWDTDVRAAKTLKINTATLRLILDVFNLFNANTALVRNDNIASSTFGTLAQNLSPRIARVGVTVGF
jgi:carboxypeptidase family protein/TonB-dependent receptor-like protein